MKRRTLLTVVLVAFGLTPALSQSLEPLRAAPVACAEVPALLDSDLGLESVVNPVLISEAEVDRAFAEFTGLDRCIDGLSSTSDRIRAASRFVDLFLSFMGPRGADRPPPHIEMVDLANTPDAAVRMLREDLGLAAPPGRVFVRYFRSPDEMPAPISAAFGSPETRAVTIGTRYVAVLTPSPRGRAEGQMLDDARDVTYSHELVHAFLNAGLGRRILESPFPRWFDEGMAIHFSGSGRAHVAIDRGSGTVFAVEPTTRYEQYERVFRYMEHRLGTGEFHRALAESVVEADASRLIERVELEGYDQLRAEAELWWRWRPLPLDWLSAQRTWVILIVVGLASAATWRLWRNWQPAVPGSALEVGVNQDLFEAVKSADDTSVRHLLRSGAEPNAVDPEGWSVLRWAVFFNRVNAVEDLLGAGARPSRELLFFADRRDTRPEILRLLADQLPPHSDEVY